MGRNIDIGIQAGWQEDDIVFPFWQLCLLLLFPLKLPRAIAVASPGAILLRGALLAAPGYTIPIRHPRHETRAAGHSERHVLHNQLRCIIRRWIYPRRTLSLA